jgi:hypothetical protein
VELFGGTAIRKRSVDGRTEENRGFDIPTLPETSMEDEEEEGGDVVAEAF